MNWFAGRIYGVLPPREAGVLAAMLLGDKSGLGKEFYENLKNTGLVHLVVVSGSNVILIVSGLIENLAWVVGRRLAIMIGLVIGWLYVALVGWEAPVMRAILLISVYYWAQLLGRKYDVMRGFVLVVLVMIMADWRIVGDLSFWLTMVAFAMVLVVNSKNELMKSIWVSLSLTPILGLVFGEISLIAPVANVMVIWIMEVVTVIGGLAVLIYDRLLWIIYPLLRYFVFIVDGLGEWQWASVRIRFNWIMLLGWYLVLFYFLIRNKIKR